MRDDFRFCSGQRVAGEKHGSDGESVADRWHHFVSVTVVDQCQFAIEDVLWGGAVKIVYSLPKHKV